MGPQDGVVREIGAIVPPNEEFIPFKEGLDGFILHNLDIEVDVDASEIPEDHVSREINPHNILRERLVESLIFLVTGFL